LNNYAKKTCVVKISIIGLELQIEALLIPLYYITCLSKIYTHTLKTARNSLRWDACCEGGWWLSYNNKYL